MDTSFDDYKDLKYLTTYDEIGGFKFKSTDPSINQRMELVDEVLKEINQAKRNTDQENETIQTNLTDYTPFYGDIDYIRSLFDNKFKGGKFACAFKYDNETEFEQILTAINAVETKHENTKLKNIDDTEKLQMDKIRELSNWRREIMTNLPKDSILNEDL